MQSSYFSDRCRRLLGAETERYFAASAEVFRGVTVNERLLDARDFAANPPFAVQPGGFSPANFRLLEPELRPGTHPWHHVGVYYVQEPSASSAAEALGVRPGDRVLDLCAAPGGKSAQLAAALRGQGLLVSNEFDAARSRILLSNSERMGAPNVLLFNETPERIAGVFAGFFNKVLVDAPCSGEGMFRKEPQAVEQHCEGLVRRCAALQAQILENAALCLAAGGELVYSTCTFSPEEDEGQIGHFLSLHSDFALVSTGLSCGCEGHENHCIGGPLDVSLVRRMYPCHGGEGHFVAKLRRAGDAAPFRPAPRKTTALPPEGAAFLRRYFPPLTGRPALCRDDTVWMLPEEPCPRAEKLHAVRFGVLAGTVEKGRFVPAHHLFHAFGGQCANTERLTLGDSRTAAYLRGEEIAAATASEGWCAVLVDGFPLGGGKVSGGKIKNHYPKGLRNLK